MTRWEYFTIVLEPGFLAGGAIDAEKLQEKLDELGREGWELVSLVDTNKTTGVTTQLIAVLKRAKA